MRSRVHNILRPYLAKLNREEVAQGREPPKIVVITDGIPPDEPDLCSLGHKIVEGRTCGECRMKDKSGMFGIFRRHRRGRRNRQNGNGKDASEDQVCSFNVS